MKKTYFFFKIGEVEKFAAECVSNDTVSWKRFFHINCQVFFLQKSQNIFKFGKINFLVEFISCKLSSEFRQ